MSDTSVEEPEKVIERPLTPRQAAFVQEYIIDFNGTQAAIRAGYAESGAGVEAVRLLADAKVANAVARLKAQRESRVNVTQESVLHEMSLLSQSNLEHYYVDDEGQVRATPGAPDGAMRAVQSIKKKTRVSYNSAGEITGKTYDVEIRLWDKPTPLKLMGRHVGLFPDRVEHVGKDGGPIELAAVSSEELLRRHKLLAEASEE